MEDGRVWDPGSTEISPLPEEVNLVCKRLPCHSHFYSEHIYHFRKVHENQFIQAGTSFVTQAMKTGWQKGSGFISQSPGLHHWRLHLSKQAQEHSVHWLLLLLSWTSRAQGKKMWLRRWSGWGVWLRQPPMGPQPTHPTEFSCLPTLSLSASHFHPR